MCPFRSFSRTCRLVEHCEKYHTDANNWCASGTKQLRVCFALYDNDMGASTSKYSHSTNYLRRSAAIIRSQVLRSSPDLEFELSHVNLIDREIRMVHYADGPSFRATDYLAEFMDMYRRLGFGYYSESCYTEASRIALDHEGRIEKVQEQMIRHCANELASLKPKFVVVWEAIFCDIFFSPAADQHLADRLEICLGGGEFETVTVDTAAKPTYSLIGKVGGNNQRSTKSKQAVQYADPLHGIHIVRWSSGSVLLVNPMLSESISGAGNLYRERFTAHRRNAARYFVADKVGPLLCRATRSVFPKIK